MDRMGTYNQRGWPPFWPIYNGVVGILFYESCSRVIYCNENRTGLLEQRPIDCKIEIGGLRVGGERMR